MQHTFKLGSKESLGLPWLCDENTACLFNSRFRWRVVDIQAAWLHVHDVQPIVLHLISVLDYRFR